MPPRSPRALLVALWIVGLLFAAALPGARAEEAPKDEKKEEKKKEIPVSTYLDRIAKHAVTISIRFQKDLEAETKGAIPPDAHSVSERFRPWRMSYVVPGFLVRDQKTVVASDLWLPPGAIASITLKPTKGREVKGKLRGFLRRAGAIVIEADEAIDAEPVPFPEKVTVGPDTPLVAGSVREGPDGPEIWLEGLGGTRRRPVDRAGFAYGQPEAVTEGLGGSGEDATRTADLVLDERAIPLGFRFGGTVDLGADVWTGPDVLADEEIPFTTLRGRAEVLASDSVMHRVKVTFRTPSRNDRRRNPFGSEDTTADAEFWGLAVDPETLVVPGRLEEEQIRKIETVRLQDDDDHGVDASFEGRVRGYDVFIVKVPGAKMKPLPATCLPVPPIGEAILVHNVAWRGGARRDQVDYDRITGWGRGYADRRFLAVERKVDEGAVLMNADGGVFGFAARLNPEDREKPLGGGRQSRDRQIFPQVAVLFCERGEPSTFTSDLDTTVMPQGETEAKRLPWIGVEYDGIDKGVAELMEVSEPTWDGARGLIVTLVYARSPAEKAGIKEGDILLSVRKASGPGSDAPPVDLHERDDGYYPGGFPFGFGDSAPAPWRPASNAITRLLQAWGVGTEYELTYLRDQQVVKANLVAELGPPDFQSAPRVKDKASGLHVRDLTYEVRAALRMPVDSKGVVVSRVEPGSPAAQARITENELIRELDGAPVEDAKWFGDRLKEGRAAKKDQVRLVVERLGKTRIVDLSLSELEMKPDAPPTPDDAGDGAAPGKTAPGGEAPGDEAPGGGEHAPGR